MLAVVFAQGQPGRSVTKGQLLELADAMEPLILDIQKKMCPNGKLNHKKVYAVYPRFINLFCKDDEFLRRLINQPLELSLNKTYSLFE